jgi:anti-sigma factor RsiW
MSCSPFDLKDYFLQELPDPQRQQVEAHVRSCAACSMELDRLRLTEAALFSLRDEEIPQRIAFVSDPVFEPSPLRRWWSGVWASPARLGFAAAALLSVAILVNGVARGVPVAMSSVDVDRRIAAAVNASETRQIQKTTQLVHQLVERVDSERNLRLVAENNAKYYEELNYSREKANGEWKYASVRQGELNR